MSDEPKDGGPAFPSAADTAEGHQMKDYGMSLRDWFAGQALAGMDHDDDNLDRWALAKAAYNIADAMLVVRAKK